MLQGFLPYAAHQEDVVVHAEGHQEHEAEQRHGGVGPREAQEVVEDQGGNAHRRTVGQHYGQHQQHRRQDGPQQQHEDDQDDHQDDGDDDHQVALRRGVGIQGRGRYAAHQRAAVDVLYLPTKDLDRFLCLR